ncbi:MAG: hypothetical protein EOM40_09875 [Clostridia bacterium]|nr:hypothetical protein [Clostridia bacterium]NCC44600.1 hypothetical protein [Clostridia bacterium]
MDEMNKKLVTVGGLTGITILFSMVQVLLLSLIGGQRIDGYVLIVQLLLPLILGGAAFWMAHIFFKTRDFTVTIIISGIAAAVLYVSYHRLEMWSSIHWIMGILMILASVFWNSWFAYYEKEEFNPKRYIGAWGSAAVFSCFIFSWILQLTYQYMIIYTLVYVGSVLMVLMSRDIVASKKYRMLLTAGIFCLVAGIFTCIFMSHTMYLGIRFETMMHPEGSSYYGRDYIAVKELWESIHLTKAVPQGNALFDIRSYLEYRYSKPMLSLGYYGGWIGVGTYIALAAAFITFLTIGIKSIWKNDSRDGKLLCVSIYGFFMIRIVCSLIGCVFPIINVPAVFSGNIFRLTDAALLGIFMYGVFEDKLDFSLNLDNFFSLVGWEADDDDCYDEEE